jgi:hypothetical protein
VAAHRMAESHRRAVGTAGFLRGKPRSFVGEYTLGNGIRIVLTLDGIQDGPQLPQCSSLGMHFNLPDGLL